MSQPISLQDYAKELKFAATTGAARIASSATSSGKLQVATGVSVSAPPGPGLRAVLTRYTGSSTRSATAADPSIVPKAADRMAQRVVQQGAELLAGGE